MLVAGAADASGGTGLAVDLGFLTRLGVRGGPLVTACVVRTAAGIRRVEPVDTGLFEAALEAALETFGDSLRAIKTGLCLERDHAERLARAALDRGIPLVVDPAIRSSEGQAYSAADPFDALAPLVDAAALLGLDVARAAALASRLGAASVPPPPRDAALPDALLAFARALAGPARTAWVGTDPAATAPDLESSGFCAAIAGPSGERLVSAPLLARGRTAGTSDALTATAAGYIALGLPADEAAAAAHRFVARALAGSCAKPGEPLVPEPWAV